MRFETSKTEAILFSRRKAHQTMAVERRCSRSCGDTSRDRGGDGTSDCAEGDDDVDEGDDDVGEGGGVNPASTPNVCRKSSALSYLATRAVAILHSLGRGVADAGSGAAIGAVGSGGGVVFGGGGADFGSGGLVFGCSVTRAPGGDPCVSVCDQPVVISTIASGAVSSSTRPRSLSWCGRAKARNSDGGREVAAWPWPPCSSRSEVQLVVRWWQVRQQRAQTGWR